jgi:hypothetical protein
MSHSSRDRIECFALVTLEGQSSMLLFAFILEDEDEGRGDQHFFFVFVEYLKRSDGESQSRFHSKKGDENSELL